jgi:phage terminase large subunit GpA-like protein
MSAPERLTVSEHADKYVVLGPSSAMPGPYRTDRTPYAKGMMDAFGDPSIEEIIVCTGTQVSKTQQMLNDMNFVIHQDPASTMMVMPTVDDAKSFAKTRFKESILGSPVIRARYDERHSETLEPQFWGMFLCFSGANSASSLSSKPIKYLFLDEVDKYPPYIGSEGEPISLAKERQKTFGEAKTVMASTPTTEHGNIWSYLQSCDAIMHYYVPCPECGHMQRLRFEQLKWPDDIKEAFKKAGADRGKIRRASQMAREAVYYECEHCKSHLIEKDKMTMLRAGEWRPDVTPEGVVRRIGFHLSTLYSPFPKATWGHMAAEWLMSKDFPEKLRNFINSWLAEPWKDLKEPARADDVMNARWKHPKETVPDGAVVLTAGVDIQKGHAYYVVRAWGEHMTSWLVDYDRFETWDVVDLSAEIRRRIVERVYYRGNEIFQVTRCLVDAGYRTDDVHSVCAQYYEVCNPTKGSSRPLGGRNYVTHKVDVKQFGFAMEWHEVNTDLAKDFIAGRLRKEKDIQPTWMACSDVTQDYADMIAAEQPVFTQNRKTGQLERHWEKTSAHVDNHYLDCEVYALTAARIIGVQTIVPEEVKPQVAPPPKKESWLGDTSNWLR